MTDPRAVERMARIRSTKGRGIGVGKCKGCGRFYKRHQLTHIYCAESCREGRSRVREKAELAARRRLGDGLGAASCPSCLARGRPIQLEEEVTSLGTVTLYCRCGYREAVRRRNP